VEIPPESEKIIKGQVCGMVKYDSVGIIESNEIFVENTGLLIINAGVQHTSNVIPLRVSNFSHQRDRQRKKKFNQLQPAPPSRFNCFNKVHIKLILYLQLLLLIKRKPSISYIE
jgi:hypothetical protein